MSAEDTPDKLEPILYRVLYCSAYQDVEGSGFRIIPLKTLLWLIGDKPPNFFQQAVRHLFLVDGDDSDVDSVLKACNHVTNLFAYFDPTPYACTLNDFATECRLDLDPPPINTTGTHPFADDDRFVCIHRPKPFRLDWLRGVLTGNDYWAFADVFIPARRARKVDGALAFYGVPNFL
ncbi:hypothetical protein B0H14DRAFT_3480382 [Mycena olivaceomarginata]|nr:hypothetical protein B0H14DRAFT_3480382 [Mycena olivaceomarginata]